MFKLEREKLLSPTALFIFYMLLSSIAIMGFRLIYPGETSPLACFSTVWRFLRGGEDLVLLFPALALSALVIPFGIDSDHSEKFTSFSPKFLQSLSPSIFNAIIAAGIYGCLAILVMPVLVNNKTDLQSKGRLFRISAERALEHAGQGEWYEAARFLSVCEKIWPNSPDIAELRVETGIRLEGILQRHDPARTMTARQDLANPKPLNAAEALFMAETAMREERYFDSHWLATLAGDLAAAGSIESASAARLASRAWNAVALMEPNARETAAYRIFYLKRSAYRALLSNDWIQSYYLFRELLSLSPGDRDGLHYIGLSEQGLVSMAFFIDELELRESPAGAIFSLPKKSGQNSGRYIMRFSSLSIFPDLAYGIGIEILSLDNEGRLLWQLDAPYAKVLPVMMENEASVTILMRALDRYDGGLRWEPKTLSFSEAAPSAAQLTLNIAWDDFRLLSDISRGNGLLSPADLVRLSGFGSDYGYLPQIFQAELINRFADPVLFLPLLILVLAMAWRFRAMKKPRYIWFPMLGILPVVFNGLFNFVINCFNNIAVWAVVSLGFSAAIIAFAAGALILFLLSLIILAAQHG